MPPPTLQQRMAIFLEATKWPVGKIAAIAKVKSQAVSQWVRTGENSKPVKSIGNLKAAILLERASGFSALWLAKGEGDQMARAAPPQTDPLELLAGQLATIEAEDRETVADMLAEWARKPDPASGTARGIRRLLGGPLSKAA